MDSNYFVGKDNSSSFVIQSSNGLEPTLKIGPDGMFSLPMLPAFSACLNQTLLEKTGAGNVVRYLANKVLANVNNCYNPDTGEFTAPSSGLYHFNCEVLTTNITPDMSYGVLKLNVGELELNRALINPAAVRVNLNQVSFTTTWFGPMKKGDKAFIQIKITGGAQDSASIHGSESCSYSSGFSGFKVA